MLADPRSRALVNNFADQWLGLRRLEAASPVERDFPDFDGELRMSMREETERFIDSMLRDDRPIPELLSANYSFINERLARHYLIPNIVGNRFRRVTMPPDRVGLLGQGSILLVTSQANRTSPVLRGKFILDNILGAPVPPPPPNVANGFKAENEAGTPVTVREALEKHRANPVCANCHARMDPWGFALENLRWHRRPALGRGRLRDRYHGGAARRHEARRPVRRSQGAGVERAISSRARSRKSSWSTRWGARSSISTGRPFAKSRKRRLPGRTGGRR